MSEPPRRTALISGGSSGIGRALAVAFAEGGYDVAIVGRDETRLDQTTREAEVTGARCVPIVADLTRFETVNGVVESAAIALGRLDVLVNAAGVFYRSNLADATEAGFDDCLAINLKAPYFLTQACLPYFNRAARAKVVNIGSVAGEVGFPEASVYCAAKAGLMGLTKALAYELAPDVNVNCVSPHNILTPMNEKLLVRDTAYRDAQLRDSPIGRLGTVADVCPAVLYLASDAADYVTGVSLFVDGGWLTH